MIKIIIPPKRERMRNACGQIVTVFKAFAKNGRTCLPLRECTAPPGEELRIFLKFLIFRHKIGISPQLAATIIEFLSRPRGRDFDCYAFANLVSNIEAHPLRFLRKFWEISLGAKEAKTGDTIFFLTEKEKHFHHAAIYLECDLCISVYGAGGGLEISSLSDMARDFNAQDVAIATPV